MKSKVVILLVLALFIGCGAPKQVIINKSINVKNVKDALDDTEPTLLYTLPKNMYKVEFTVKTTYYKEGPYKKYSKKYLNIDAPETNDYVKSEISNVEINSYPVPDYVNTYSIHSEGLNNINYINLTKAGLIGGFGVGDKSTSEDLRILSVQKNINGFSEIESYFNSVPFVKRQVNEIPISGKAKETAKIIKTIRKRRNKMLTGKYKILLPDGKSFEVMAEETAKVEREYLSLFVGKTMTYETKYSYMFTPEKDNLKKVLCYFDSEKGIVTKKSKKTKDITIETIVDSGFSNLQFAMADNTGVIYRIPAQSVMKVNIDNNELFLQNVQVPQLGKLVSIPQNVLFNDNITIEFYKNTGALKSIMPNK